jgi:predicted nicotinamide N-methyase
MSVAPRGDEPHIRQTRTGVAASRDSARQRAPVRTLHLYRTDPQPSTGLPPTRTPITPLRATDPPIAEYHLRLGEHAWSVMHMGAILTDADETHYLGEVQGRIPYGVMLWPSSIALAHELAARAAGLDGLSVLELGAGTGLPGIVAATFGARVVQTDRIEVALGLCRSNAERNHVTIQHRLADWTDWNVVDRYDLILGADVLYGARLHPFLRHIFDSNLMPDGRILLSDPFRAASLTLLEAMEPDGWSIGLSKWSVGEAHERKAIGVYELARNGQTKDQGGQTP